MYAVKSNSLIHTVRVGDIFGSIKNKLTGGAGTQAAATASPGLLYMFFHHFFPDESPDPQTTVNYLRSLGVPETVVQKAVSAGDAFKYMHDHWGVSYHDGADISDTNSATRQALRMFLGMEPQKYLSMVVPLPSNAPKISGIGMSYMGSILDTVSSILPSLKSTASNGLLPGEGVAKTALSVAMPGVGTGVAAVASAVEAGLQQVLKNVITFNTPPQSWYDAYPKPDDWSGWTRATVKPGTYVPSVNDPLGITGYNGSTFGAAPLSSAAVPTTAVQQQSATQASAGGSNKWVTIIFVGSLLGLLGWNFLRHNQ